MKKFFLLAGLMLCFVLVQAVRVVEPPGKNHVINYPVVCQGVDVEYQAIDISVVYAYEMPVSFTPYAVCVAVEKAELSDFKLIPDVGSLDLLFWNKHYDDFEAVARSGVLNKNDLSVNYSDPLTVPNLNFDGNQDRFY